jgi:hypothetical protein
MYNKYGSGSVCGAFKWYAQGTLINEENNPSYGWSYCAVGIECFTSIYGIPPGYGYGWLTPYGMESSTTLQ